MKFAKVIDEILLTETPKKRAGTQAMHKRYLGWIRQSLGSRDLRKFSLKDYALWIDKERAGKPERTTFDDYTKFFNIISNFAYQRQYITHKIKYPRTDSADRDQAGRVYTHKELAALWLAMDEKLKPHLILSLECFMRLREALHLTWDRIDLDDRKIILRKQDVKTGTKSSKGRVIPMSENAYDVLCELHDSATTKWVFPNPRKNGPLNENRKLWFNAKKRAGIKGRARWHDLRHTALSMAAIDKNVNLANLSLVAGVSVRTIQRIYLHATVDQLRGVTEAINILEIA